MIEQSATAASLTRHLVEQGALKQADLEKAQRLIDENPQSLGLLLTRVGLTSEQDVAAAYAAIFDCPLLADEEIPMAPLPDQTYKESFLRNAKIFPIAANDDGLTVATADPENDFALEALSMASGKPINLRIGTLTQIDRTLEQWFGNGADEDANDIVAYTDERASDDSDAIDRLRDLASEAPIVRLVNSIIQHAVAARASDIHVEPFDGELRIRYRVDGVLVRSDSLPAHSSAAVISRIKLMARMNIAERRLPQDGRVQIRVQGSAIDLRVSTVPTVDGESVVLRILDQDSVAQTLDTLGFDSVTSREIQRAIALPHGIVLVTGPTGSGKTTTLYALLQQLNSAERKILTIEDPVEYQLEGINQIQVKPQIGLDFPRALRSIVRQDPDVIMVGEMRDLETARIAVQSALTGHLVFSTLHTNDAGSSVTRLLDMGIEDYLVTSSVNAIIAQRLIRRLCEQCREPYSPVDSLIRELRLDALSDDADIVLYRAIGCEHCKGTGYLGRTVIAEMLVLSDQIRRAILEQADGKAIEKIAVDGGMRTMKTDGMQKVLAGITTIEEVTRVTYLA